MLQHYILITLRGIVKNKIFILINTIGDAYMCAGGLPSVSKTHAINVIMEHGK